MGAIFRILIGLGILAIGVLIVWKTERLYEWLGASEFAETKMATMGGTRAFYKLIGLGFCFIGIIVMTDLFNSFFYATLGNLLGIEKPVEE